MKFKETEIKYLAGLMDADGSIMFHFSKYKDDRYNVSVKLVLQQSLSIDKDGQYIDWLSSYGGFKQFVKVATATNPNWSDATRWTVTSLKELNMIVPRLAKHMVIKAKHFQAMLDKLNSIHGKSVSSVEMNELKEFAKISRKNVGPLKPKKHPTWAWIAGYIDGDGCYYQRKRKKNWGVYTELLVKIVSQTQDKVGLELLHKAFGGNLKPNKNEDTWSWYRNLGNKDKSFAFRFLKKMAIHSRLKKT